MRRITLLALLFFTACEPGQAARYDPEAVAWDLAGSATAVQRDVATSQAATSQAEMIAVTGAASVSQTATSTAAVPTATAAAEQTQEAAVLGAEDAIRLRYYEEQRANEATTEAKLNEIEVAAAQNAADRRELWSLIWRWTFVLGLIFAAGCLVYALRTWGYASRRQSEVAHSGRNKDLGALFIDGEWVYVNDIIPPPVNNMRPAGNTYYIEHEDGNFDRMPDEPEPGALAEFAQAIVDGRASFSHEGNRGQRGAVDYGYGREDFAQLREHFARRGWGVRRNQGQRNEYVELNTSGIWVMRHIAETGRPPLPHQVDAASNGH